MCSRFRVKSFNLRRSGFSPRENSETWRTGGPDHVFRAWPQTRGCSALLWWETRYGKADWWDQQPWISLGSHLGSCCCPVTTLQLGNADLSDMCNHLGPWWHLGVCQRPWLGPWLYHSLALWWCPWPKSSKNPGPLGCYLWPCRSLGNMSLLGPCQLSGLLPARISVTWKIAWDH